MGAPPGDGSPGQIGQVQPPPNVLPAGQPAGLDEQPRVLEPGQIGQPADQVPVQSQLDQFGQPVQQQGQLGGPAEPGFNEGEQGQGWNQDFDFGQGPGQT